MKYEPVSTRDSEDDISKPTYLPPSLWKRFCHLIPWILTCMFASLSILLGILLDNNYQWQQNERLGTFAAGYKTDFVTSREHIRISQHRFTGAPSFDADGNIIVANPDPMRYVGDPRVYPEIDHNWNELTWGRYILITKEEAIATWGEDIELYWDKQRGGYVAGLDMFHTLHCLNNLRKALNPDFYGDGHGHHKTRSTAANEALHQDHCIEQMRQYIMCSGDMTPIPTKYYPALGRNYVDSDVPHTCRNFEALHTWVMDRYDGPGAVKPQFE